MCTVQLAQGGLGGGGGEKMSVLHIFKVLSKTRLLLGGPLSQDVSMGGRGWREKRGMV